MTKITEKFTATLVHAADKALVVDLREASGLSEKDIMAKIIKFGLTHSVEILEEAKAEVEAAIEEKKTRAKENYELMKQKMKEARDQAKAEREARAAAKQAVAQAEADAQKELAEANA